MSKMKQQALHVVSLNVVIGLHLQLVGRFISVKEFSIVEKREVGHFYTKSVNAEQLAQRTLPTQAEQKLFSVLENSELEDT
mmetsp:Transcript_5441/g.12303  ORF Transcript_5441/g.12303 Transcript_5441/m.12303 type:complete len:81 (-) Transcript_5441:475-717(-)